MRIRPPHRWDVSIAEARAIQETLRREVVERDSLGAVATVAGVDVGPGPRREEVRAAVVVLDIESLAVVETSVAVARTAFPYIPGYLSFRELPAVCEAFDRLGHTPDAVLCDGQGRAHPRRFGLACHLGVLSDLPCLGVGKSRLVGRHEPVPDRKGAWVPLLDGDELIGAVLRTRAGVKPVFVSVGHRLSLPAAVRLVMRCVTRYRLPETTRHADRLASRR